MDVLKLIAFDAEDLTVISAHVHQATVRVEECIFLPKEYRFALALRRQVIDPQDETVAQTGPVRWRQAALHFERVLAVQHFGIERKPGTDRTVAQYPQSLLAVLFHETQAPSGWITLVFAGGGGVRLSVECVEAQLKDLSSAWEE